MQTTKIMTEAAKHRLAQIDYALKDIAETLALWPEGPHASLAIDYVRKLHRERNTLVAKRQEIEKSGELMVPFVHMNGTSKARLIEQIENAYDAIGKALDAMKQTAPNGRDYYPLGQSAREIALDQHMARMAKLSSVQSELEAIAGAIGEQ
jgi:hypothetical protein